MDLKTSISDCIAHISYDIDFKLYIARNDLKTSTPERIAQISYDVDFEIYIAGLDLKTSVSDWIAHISDDVILNYILQEWIPKFQFRNRLTISHMKLILKKKTLQELISKCNSGIDCLYLMMLTLKYKSQELISNLQFRNGLPITHMMLILKRISQELISKCNSGLDCQYLK